MIFSPPPLQRDVICRMLAVILVTLATFTCHLHSAISHTSRVMRPSADTNPYLTFSRCRPKFKIPGPSLFGSTSIFLSLPNGYNIPFCKFATFPHKTEFVPHTTPAADMRSEDHPECSNVKSTSTSENDSNTHSRTLQYMEHRDRYTDIEWSLWSHIRMVWQRMNILPGPVWHFLVWPVHRKRGFPFYEQLLQFVHSKKTSFSIDFQERVRLS